MVKSTVETYIHTAGKQKELLIYQFYGWGMGKSK
jgi:hypothetical protein